MLYLLRWREHGDSSWHSETIKPNRKSSYEWTGKLAIQGTIKCVFGGNLSLYRRFTL